MISLTFVSLNSEKILNVSFNIEIGDSQVQYWKM